MTTKHAATIKHAAKTAVARHRATRARTPILDTLGLLAEARSLRSEDGENPEYDRALVELATFALSGTQDDFRRIARRIGITRDLWAPAFTGAPVLTPPAPHYRVRFTVDPEATFEECNGSGEPLSEDEYAENVYRACPDHPRAGSKTIDGTATPPVTGCAICGRTDYADIPYDEYRAYYGNPNRHVYLECGVQRQCPACKCWKYVGGTSNIDCMDDNPEVDQIGDWFTPEEIIAAEKRLGYLYDVAIEDLTEAGWVDPRE